MSEKNYITKTGWIKLQDTLNNLLNIERPQIVETINWAAGNGDRSENGDYIYGKKRLREIDKQIYRLTKQLETTQVIDTSIHLHQTKVFFGATVTIHRNHTIKQTVTIVGEYEINPEKNHISWKSPIGKALLGKTIGDEFLFNSQQGETIIEILDVSY